MDEVEIIEGFPNYRVFKNGLVQSNWKGIGTHRKQDSEEWSNLNPHTSKWGSLVVNLSRGGNKNSKHRRVGILVTTAFLGPCPHRRYLKFKDGDKSNCKLENLSWEKKPDGPQSISIFVDPKVKEELKLRATQDHRPLKRYIEHLLMGLSVKVYELPTSPGDKKIIVIHIDRGEPLERLNKIAIKNGVNRSKFITEYLSFHVA